MNHEKPFERENRYIVFKLQDVTNARGSGVLSRSQHSYLISLQRIVQQERTDRGKAPLKCVVVEKDWPEYELVWALLEARVRAQTCLSSAADASHSRAVLELQKLAELLKQENPVEGAKPAVGGWWTHHNGNRYEVVLLSNEDSDNPDYPVTVSYRGENGRVWSKTLENFLAKMTPLVK